MKVGRCARTSVKPYLSPSMNNSYSETHQNSWHEVLAWPELPLLVERQYRLLGPWQWLKVWNLVSNPANLNRPNWWSLQTAKASMAWWYNYIQRLLSFASFMEIDEYGSDAMLFLGYLSFMRLANDETLLPFCTNAVMRMVRGTWPIPDPACWSSSQAGHRPENRHTSPAFVLVCGSIEVIWGPGVRVFWRPPTTALCLFSERLGLPLSRGQALCMLWISVLSTCFPGDNSSGLNMYIYIY